MELVGWHEAEEPRNDWRAIWENDSGKHRVWEPSDGMMGRRFGSLTTYFFDFLLSEPTKAGAGFERGSCSFGMVTRTNGSGMSNLFI